MGSSALVVWFTGLSGSGKTTIATEAARALGDKALRATVVDGDDIRRRLGRGLGFSRADLASSNTIAMDVCEERRSDQDVVMVSRISPLETGRREARERFGAAFMLVYVSASLESVVARDPKGLYARARDPEGAAMIGTPGAVPYEPPTDADLVLDTERADAATLADRLVSAIEERLARERRLSGAGRP